MGVSFKSATVLATGLQPLNRFPKLGVSRASAVPLLIAASLSTTLCACAPGSNNAANPSSTDLPSSSSVSNSTTQSKPQIKLVRIGYQKYGSLFLLKARGTLDKRLKDQGISVQWTQFPAGPQMLEALNTGSLDYGSTGETPPIFAQAAGAPLVYVANESPDPDGEAILVSKNSPIQKVSDLKGKKVALNKGANVHYLLVKALESAGLKYSDIQPVYLPPAEARASFAQGSVDAWAIWEPYLSAAKQALSARVLANGNGIVANRQFYLATKSFAAQSPDTLKEIVEETRNVDAWAKAHINDAATILSPQVGIDVPLLTEILKGRSYQVEQINPQTVAYQQQIADTFLKLGLLPKPISVKEVAQLPN